MSAGHTPAALDIEGVDALSGQIDALLVAPGSTHGLRRALRGLAREVQLFRAHQAGCEAVAAPFAARRVQIGGGARLLPGFVNIDILPPADVIYDVREGSPSSSLPRRSSDRSSTHSRRQRDRRPTPDCRGHRRA